MGERPASNRARLGVWAAGLASILAALGLAYRRVLSYGLVWDDWVNLGADAGFRRPAWEAVRWAFTELRLGHYQPLAWLSFTLDHRLWGDQLGGYHLTNLLLHAANVLLFAAVARRLLAHGRSEEIPSQGTLAGSLAAAAIFALHPMRVETVAWLTERRHLLAALLFLAALLAYLRGLEPGGRRGTAMLLCSLGFALSLLATPLGVGLPVVLVVVDVVPYGRWRPGDGWRRLGRLLAEKAPLWLLAAAFSVTALAAQRAGEALLGLAGHSPPARLAQAAYGLAFYPRALFATAWYPLHERPAQIDPLSPRFLPALMAVAAVAALLIWKRRRWPVAVACAVAYTALLAPVSGLAQSGAQLVADRYGYLALGPWLVLLGTGIAWLWRRLHDRGARALLATALIAATLAWAVATRRQTEVWESDRALWEQVLRGGESALASTHLGILAWREGRLDEALRRLRAAIETAPRYGNAWRAVLSLLEREPAVSRSAELPGLVRALEAGFEAQSHTAVGWRILGLASWRSGDPEEALGRLRRAAEMRGDQAVNWRWLGVVALEAGRRDEAAHSFERALDLEPGDAASRRGLAAALAGPEAGR